MAAAGAAGLGQSHGRASVLARSVKHAVETDGDRMAKEAAVAGHPRPVLRAVPAIVDMTGDVVGFEGRI
jgi:hypothetical protein